MTKQTQLGPGKLVSIVSCFDISAFTLQHNFSQWKESLLIRLHLGFDFFFNVDRKWLVWGKKVHMIISVTWITEQLHGLAVFFIGVQKS